jgi:hypothetical protein
LALLGRWPHSRATIAVLPASEKPAHIQTFGFIAEAQCNRESALVGDTLKLVYDARNHGLFAIEDGVPMRVLHRLRTNPLPLGSELLA